MESDRQLKVQINFHMVPRNIQNIWQNIEAI